MTASFPLRVAPWLLALALAACSGEQPSESLRTAADDTPAEHALKHTNPKYRCPMHPQIVRDEPGQCPICGMALVKFDPEPTAAGGRDAPRKPLYYRNPMDPAQRSPVPAKDSMGMDYVPVYAENQAGEVRISPAVVHNLGVRTEPVQRGTLPRRVDAVGYVQFDERRVRQVRTRAEGWVEGLSVRAEGERVAAGQLLFTLYSPMLESAQQEFIDALRIGNADLIAASRERLTALGLDRGTAARLEKSGRTTGRVPFHAPIAGVVTGLEVREGAMLSPDMVAVTITELGSLWVIVEVPEGQAAWLGEGTHANVRFPSLAGETVHGMVEYVYPELNMETRTVRARITLERPPPGIRPNMLARVDLMAEGGEDTLHVPRSALIRHGVQDRVVVALGEGRFASRPVTAGAESGDRVAIREGLHDGERVVVSAQFLLDSEANLGAGLGRLEEPDAEPRRDAQPDDPHAGH